MSNQEKLEEVYEMTLQNNMILRSMRRQQHIANTFRFLYWLIILGALGGAYYYLRPVITSVADNKSKIEETLKQFDVLRAQLPESRLFDQVFQGVKTVATSTPQ